MIWQPEPQDRESVIQGLKDDIAKYRKMARDIERMHREVECSIVGLKYHLDKLQGKG